MNILYCGDVGIARGVLISILSILKHNPEPISFFVMTIDGAKASKDADPRVKEVRPFPEKSAIFLDDLVKKTNSKNSFTLIDATNIFLKNLPTKNMGSYFTPCSMLRLYLDQVPVLQDLDRILYLDYDVVCRANLTDFYHTDLDGIEAAGVLDIYGRHFYHYHGLFNDDYMNSGVMLFNIAECKKTKMFKNAIKLCQKRWMMLADQAALNKSITHRRLMPRKYNEQGERPRTDTVLHHFSNNFKFWPYFRVQKVKPYDIARVHSVLKIHEYDDIYDEYEKLKSSL
ncbi:glycosyltransferase family 8 protein [Candidatus Saccharibacteria bacterium]|nr:glycosyltransferase family 8 protein [Candidatus Saccharibacteria bacterium]